MAECNFVSIKPTSDSDKGQEPRKAIGCETYAWIADYAPNSEPASKGGDCDQHSRPQLFGSEVQAKPRPPKD